MESSDSHPPPPVGDVSLLPATSSVFTKSGKRLLLANAVPYRPPTKKQRQQLELEPFDLERLTLLYTTNGRLSTTALSLLSEPAFTGGEIRNLHYYSYDELREWLLQTAKIPRERAMGTILPNLNGEDRMYPVHDKWSFGALLGIIKKGVLTVPLCVDYGYVLQFESYSGSPLLGTPHPIPEVAIKEPPEPAPPVAQPIEEAMAKDAEDEVAHEGRIGGPHSSNQQSPPESINSMFL